MFLLFVEKKTMNPNKNYNNDDNNEDESEELVNLGGELSKLTDTNSSRAKRLDLARDELKRRIKAHKDKYDIFRQRVRLNNNRFLSVLNATETALRVATERREEIERMRVDKVCLTGELSEIEIRLTELRREAGKYREHHQFLNQAFELIKSGFDMSSIGEMTKRHETLRLNWRETMADSELKMDTVRAMRSDGDALARETINQVIELHQTRIEAESRLIEARNQTDQAEENLENSRQAYVSKVLELNQITNSIDNMFCCLSSNRNELSSLKTNKNSSSTKTFFQKLDFIEQRYIELEEFCNRAQKSRSVVESRSIHKQ